MTGEGGVVCFVLLPEIKYFEYRLQYLCQDFSQPRKSVTDCRRGRVTAHYRLSTEETVGVC